MAVERVIILVHGTFAKNAPWTKGDSVFVQGLKKELGSNIHVERFNWSGRNSYMKRVQAGKELAVFLQATEIKYSGSEKIIIGHSHGGNVIFYALKHMPDKAHAFRIVTLATPFLISEMRANKKTFDLLDHFLNYVLTNLVVLISGFLTFFFVVYALGSMLTDYLRHTNDFTKADMWLFALYAVISLCVCLYYKRSSAFGEQETKDYVQMASEMLKRIDIGIAEKEVKLLSVVYKLDEAETWLKTSSAFTKKVFSVFDFLSRLARKPMMVLGQMAVTFILLALLLGAALESWFGVNKDRYFELAFENIGPYAVFPFIYLTIAYFAVLLGVSMLFYFTSANPLFFGWKSWKHFLYIKTTPSAYPSHVANPVFAELILKKRSFLSLRHSLIYNDPNVHKLVGEWIKANNSIRGKIRMKAG